MTTLSKLPILKLPRLALQNVVSSFHYREMLMLLICYPKIRHFKLLSTKTHESHKIVVEITSTSPAIGFLSHRGFPIDEVLWLVEVHGQTGKPSRKHSEDFEIDGVKGSLVVSDPYDTYWEDEKKGVEVLIGLLCDVFRVEVEELRIKKSTMWALDWIHRRQVAPLQGLVVLEDKTSLTVEDVEEILTNSRCSAHDVFLLANIPRSLRVYFPANFERLIIYYGWWLTTFNLIDLCHSCQQISFVNSVLYVSEIKQIIKYWLTIGMESIRYLSFEVHEFAVNRMEILETLIEYLTNLYEETKNEDFKGDVVHLDESLEFRREDGAVVNISNCPRTDFVTLSFFRKEEVEEARDTIIKYIVSF